MADAKGFSAIGTVVIRPRLHGLAHYRACQEAGRRGLI